MFPKIIQPLRMQESPYMHDHIKLCYHALGKPIAEGTISPSTIYIKPIKHLRKLKQL